MLSKGLGYFIPGFLGVEENHESEEQSSAVPSESAAEMQGSIVLVIKGETEC